MKDARLWEEEDILNLISIGARESQFLEFKACESLVNTDKNKMEISKDVSSFANSAGGTIVYGLIENKNSHEAERVDEGYDPRAISELWLEEVVNSNIQRRIDGLHINVVSLKETHLERFCMLSRFLKASARLTWQRTIDSTGASIFSRFRCKNMKCGNSFAARHTQAERLLKLGVTTPSIR